MSLKDKNIEELFRSELEDFEMPVDQSVWSNISKGIAQGAVANTATSTTSWLTYLGISAAAITIGVVATLAYIDTNNTSEESPLNTTPQNKSTLITQKEAIKATEIITKIETEDATFVKEIAKPSILVNDPVILQEEQKAIPKKVIVASTNIASEEIEPTKKPINSWVDTWRTPTKVGSNTENENTTDNVSDLNEQTIPTIVEVEKDKIIASIVAAPVGGYAPLEVSFAQQSEIGKITWDFGDETTSFDSSPTHTFEKYGIYKVTLTIENENGDIVKDTKEIEVLASSAIMPLPNIFTPNNDGNNDLLIIEAKNIESYLIMIHDKKGSLIFESDDINNPWGGRNKYDELVPAGYYALSIIAIGIDGKVYKPSSSVAVKY